MKILPVETKVMPLLCEAQGETLWCERGSGRESGYRNQCGNRRSLQKQERHCPEEGSFHPSVVTQAVWFISSPQVGGLEGQPLLMRSRTRLPILWGGQQGWTFGFARWKVTKNEINLGLSKQCQSNWLGKWKRHQLVWLNNIKQTSVALVFQGNASIGPQFRHYVGGRLKAWSQKFAKIKRTLFQEFHITWIAAAQKHWYTKQCL